MSQSARFVLTVLKALTGRTVDGVSNVEIATALDTSPVNVSRALKDLVDEQLVEKLPTGRYAHSIHMQRIAEQTRAERDRAAARMAELTQRTTRTF